MKLSFNKGFKKIANAQKRVFVISICWIFLLAAHGKLSTKNLDTFVAQKKLRLSNHINTTFTCNGAEGLFVPGQVIVRYKTKSSSDSFFDNQRIKSLSEKQFSYRKLLPELSTKILPAADSQNRLIAFQENFGSDRLYLITWGDKNGKALRSTNNDCLELQRVIEELKQHPDIDLVEQI